MPQMTDITVENGAVPPVSKTFTAITPASGYGSWAQWALKEGAIAAVFPTLNAKSTQLSGGAVQKLELEFRLPSSYTDSVTGLTNVGTFYGAKVQVTVPNTLPESLKGDSVAFLTNLIASNLIKAMLRDASPAT